jgi:hypothetical protein
MVEVDFPKRPPLPRDLERRPRPDEFLPGAVHRAWERDLLDSPPMGELDTPDIDEPPIDGLQFDTPRGRADESRANEGRMGETSVADARAADLTPSTMTPSTVVNLRKLQETLARKPLDEIATLVHGLTYGEMIEMAEAIWKTQPEGLVITLDNLPALLHRWSKSHSTPDRAKDAS